MRHLRLAKARLNERLKWTEDTHKMELQESKVREYPRQYLCKIRGSHLQDVIYIGTAEMLALGTKQ